MPIYLGENTLDIPDIKLGNINIQKLYLDNVIIYPPTGVLPTTTTTTAAPTTTTTTTTTTTPAAQNNLSFSNYYKASADNVNPFPDQYSVSGQGTSGSPMTVTVGGGNAATDDEDHRVWLLVNQTGTLSWSISLSGSGYQGEARLFRHAGTPSQHGWSSSSIISGGTAISNTAAAGNTLTGTASVTEGEYLVVRWMKDEGPYGQNPTATAILSIASITTTTTTTTSTTTTAAPFSPMAVMLTTGSSYTVPTGATTMKAWAIGSGGNYDKGAGGTAYKTWNVNGGSSVAYTVGAAVNNAGAGSLGNNTTITYNNTTITGCGGGRLINGFGFDGGDGGANGGVGQYQGGGEYANGAVGGNTPQGVVRPIFKATDIGGLFAVLNLLGIDPTTSINWNYAISSNPNVFGAGTKFDKYGAFTSGGIGGGNGYGTNETRETGAVILYFT